MFATAHEAAAARSEAQPAPAGASLQSPFLGAAGWNNAPAFDRSRMQMPMRRGPSAATEAAHQAAADRAAATLPASHPLFAMHAAAAASPQPPQPTRGPRYTILQ